VVAEVALTPVAGSVVVVVVVASAGAPSLGAALGPIEPLMAGFTAPLELGGAIAPAAPAVASLVGALAGAVDWA